MKIHPEQLTFWTTKEMVTGVIAEDLASWKIEGLMRALPGESFGLPFEVVDAMHSSIRTKVKIDALGNPRGADLRRRVGT